MSRKYKVVDVFSNKSLLGNPVAVILNAEGLTTEEMQRIAAWTNLSETTFILPPHNKNADYLLRIFTPRSELPFAGHPTLGSAHAALEAGLVAVDKKVIVQECRVGLVNIAIDEKQSQRIFSFDLPPAKITTLSLKEVQELEAILGHSVLHNPMPAIINVGAIWVIAKLENAETVLSLSPDFQKSLQFEKQLGVTGITVFGSHSNNHANFEVRSFAPSCGVNEDPVCGSGNGCVAVFLAKNSLLGETKNYIASQGKVLGREGKVLINYKENGQITVGGECVTTINGVFNS